MRLKKEVNLAELMGAVRQCGKDVWFDTPEGDHLNLKSALSQFVFVVAVGGKGYALTGEILCSPEDRERLLPFTEE